MSVVIQEDVIYAVGDQMLDGYKTILIISSHTDDAELSMGGTINRLIKSGCDVHHLILSDAREQAKKRGYDWDTLRNESKKANKKLGIKEENTYLLKVPFPTDYFDTRRQDIANLLYKYKMFVKPDVVFVNSSFDTHQDHQVTHQETKRIFKDIGILGYEFPHNNLKFKYDFLVCLTEEHIQSKINAIKVFESQQDRVYCNEEYILALGRVNAVRMKSRFYAEAFEVVRLIW